MKQTPENNSNGDHQKPAISAAGDRLLKAYHDMLNFINNTIDDAIEQADKEAIPTLESNLEKAKQQASELGELSREEADKIAAYLKRDLQEAGQFLTESGAVIRDWFKFDVALVEDRFMETFSRMADQTHIELEKLEHQANTIGEWHTGEITGIGTFRCSGCGKELHFHQPGHIPPCPTCHGTVFKRASKQD